MRNPILFVDNYKLDHFNMYPKGLSKLYSNFTPRQSRIKGIDSVVVFGIQKFINDYLIESFNRYFFYIKERYNPELSNHLKESVLNDYKKHVKLDSCKHIEDLWDLGYLPIEIKALPEGTRCPIGVPMLTITNTHKDFAWLVNYLETLISTQLWQAMTSATISNKYREIIDKWSFKTTGTTEGNEWMGHDFSMRGMSSIETAIISGMAHLLSFRGSDVVPAIYQMEEDYGVKDLIAGGVPATEHSIEMLHYNYETEEEDEYLLYLLEKYPTGILSIVCDGKDFWKFITVTIPKYKDKILARDGKVVIRPDSGNPYDIICGEFIKSYDNITDSYDSFREDLEANEVFGEGYFSIPENRIVKIVDKYFRIDAYATFDRHDKTYYYIDDIEFKAKEVTLDCVQKGAIEVLWDTFGGTVNELGYKVLDSHIGLIYGDSIGLHNLDKINSGLEYKKFATTNWVAGFGSYGYQYNTRDTFGFAMKATYGEITSLKPKFFGDNNIEVEEKEIFKDPKTGDGLKKSAKGLLKVYRPEGAHGYGNITLKDSCTKQEETEGLLQTVFKDGKLTRTTTLDEIKERLGTL